MKIVKNILLNVLVMILYMICTETAFCLDAGDVKEFGESKGEPINTGFFFHEGKYVDTPYVIERRGLNIYVNDILLIPGSTFSLYDMTVDTDPGEPPAGSSPFDKIPDGVDPRDTYWPKKWRYLNSHFDSNSAQDMIFETYKKSDAISNVRWEDSSTKELLIITSKSGNKEKKISYSLNLGGPSKGKVTKEDLINAMEKEKDFQERRFRKNAILFKKGGMSVITGGQIGLKALEILLSDANDNEKIKSLENGVLLRRGVKTSYWIVTDFKDSPQLRERVNNMKKEYNLKPIISETRSLLMGGITAPALDSGPIASPQTEKVTEQAETVVTSPNIVSTQNSIPKNSTDANTLSNSHIKSLSQIENDPYPKKTYIIGSLIVALGILFLLVRNIYRGKRTYRKEEEK